MTQYLYSRIYRKRILILLTILFLLSAGLYVYFLQQTVRHVVQRDTLDDNIATLHSEIGDAEFSYGSSISEVSMEKALALGFSSVNTTSYVTRADRGTFVSLNVTTE